MDEFNPACEYGRYVMLDHPNASEAEVQQAKNRLMPELCELIPEAFRQTVVWEVRDVGRATGDPLGLPATMVAWRYKPH